MKAFHDLPAPAKLNLFLHVTGRRADGMHLLQSVFMLIDWHDTLHIERRPGGALSREDLGAALPPQDLCLRAAAALQQATGCREGVHIAIDKRIPAEAGMGGGSSDAATCLLALNRLWNLGLDLPALERIGLSLGADVPFFLRGRNAWVEGIGERITPIELPPVRCVVLKPQQGLATAKIFSDAQLNRSSEPAILTGFAAGPYDFGRNDLQPVAQRLCPGISEALGWLESQGWQGRMTGSGSAVFAILGEGEPARKSDALATSALTPPPGMQLRICSNLPAHPLRGWAGSDSSRVEG
ncbi:4-(cytidine 5'-diphospho)-2-C-methyl-D-erythritol kinase [Ramlibacter rhizophilus]|uniref:4-diphosphocytidyl-2-C-methyl-D-erythritol kinase n=1 Tax=Ramlibacter rhizophilus TaxID=1781167 RepID=A0A4Z0BQU5_9BURK|nr:4-(cytidine 5'-diphospho)-2-C-methyl-D-erythritol kinase [Ramlibacter rhizophilus]TFZ01142.1 4-(cytidine 5'-diphospho)-2-C-methyl-D-erythritol kinase [Ramlibacter rhizophilus]